MKTKRFLPCSDRYYYYHLYHRHYYYYFRFLLNQHIFQVSLQIGRFPS